MDLVEDLCDSVAIVDRGRLVLSGRVSELKQSGGRRVLRVLLDETAPSGSDGWAGRLPGVEVAGADARGVRLLLGPSVDPLQVLTRAAAAGRVVDFGLELPRLSQLFREAVNR